MSDRIRKEFSGIVPLIRKKGIEKVASILKDNGYSVDRNVDTSYLYLYPQNEFSMPREYYIKDIVACKDIGKSWLMIEINLRSKTLYAWSKPSRRKDWLTTVIPFRDYSIDELVKAIRKSPKYQIWHRDVLDLDFGKCQNEKCGIDIRAIIFACRKIVRGASLKVTQKNCCGKQLKMSG